MPLPEREYFYLQEVTRKLDMSEFDLQYYISHGYLMASVWLNRDIFQYQFQNPHNNNEYAFGPKDPHEGYAYIDSCTAREVFTCGMTHATSFYVSYPDTVISLADKDPRILVRRSALMISVWDFDFFVARYGLSETSKSGPAGRPSTTRLTMEEHARRVASGKNYKNRTQEAQALYDWHCLHHKDITPPSRDTIRNALMKFDPRDYQDCIK